MADKRDAKTKRSGHSGVRIDTPIYLKTGPVRIKPVQNMMFELDSTSTRGIVGSPKIDRINDKAIGLTPFNIKHINCQEVGKSTTNLVSTSHAPVGPASLNIEHLSCQEAGKVPTKSAPSTHQAVGQDPVRMDHTNCQTVCKVPTKSAPSTHQAVGQDPVRMDHTNYQTVYNVPTRSAPSTHQAVGQDPVRMDRTNCQTVYNVPTRSESVHHPGVGSNSSDGNAKHGFPTSMSFGSFTIAQLAGDGVETTKVQPKYNAGVLQGNWFDERMHPKYRPIHPPPLNTCNLDYRSTYKDSFLNHNLKDFSFVKPIKKDYSLPAWFVHDEIKKVSPRTRPHANKEQRQVGEGCDGKDPYKGHDLDPFKRRDEYKTGYEYKMDAFQDNPRLWDKYHGRENYFKRKEHGDRYSSHTENVPMQAGDGPISADYSDVSAGIQHDSPTPESLVANRAQGHEEGRMGNISNDKHGVSGMAGHDKSHCPDMGRHDEPHTPNMDHMSNRGNRNPNVPDIGHVSRIGHTKPHAPDMCHMGNMGHTKPHAPDMGHVTIVRQLEADLRKLNRTTSEYKSNFKPMETSAVTTAAKQRREHGRVFATTRNISTFAF